MLQKTGYQSISLPADITLGALDGIDAAIWSYAFATIIFSGTLAAFVPIGLFVILVGWALHSLVVIATSKLRSHMISIDEQAVVILGSIGALLAAKLGSDGNSSEGLSTMLAIVVITSLAVSAGLFLAGQFRITRLLELIPYPVVCGFMAGVAWLMLDAGVVVATDVPISGQLAEALGKDDNLLRLALSLGGGIALVGFTRWLKKAWALPAAALALIAGFYAVVWASGATVAELVAGGWLFDIDSNVDSIGSFLSRISPAEINGSFILSVVPEIATIVFLATLNNAMSLSILSAIKFDVRMNPSKEMKIVGGANILCALVGSPPGATDEVASLVYEEFGASSRWMPIASSVVLLAVAFLGTTLIAFMPKVVVGALIFLFAIEMLAYWMYENVRKFSLADYITVCVILVTVVFVGFVEGILVGILLIAAIFVLRYSLISAIQGQYSLEDHRSSVERSASANSTLNRHGGEALVFTLRGYLFFGTTNAIRDAINASIEQGTHMAILLDLSRVTGIDISALQTFQQTKQQCEASGIELLCSRVPEEARDRILAMDAVSLREGQPMIFAETDLALECMEDAILAKYSSDTATGSVQHHLSVLLGDNEKARLISEMMDKVECGVGERIFTQGDSDTGFYILETGTMTASIDDGQGGALRVKKFTPGSIIGELSSYSADNKRSATVVADEPSVLYHLDPARLAETPGMEDALSAVHEMVARTLTARIDYMNRRLIKEMG